MSTDEQAVSYACMILASGGQEVTSENIEKVLAAVGIEVEAYWVPMFAKMFAKNPIDEVIMEGSGVSAGGGGGGGGGGGDGEAEEEEKVEEEPEEEAAIGGLFGGGDDGGDAAW